MQKHVNLVDLVKSFPTNIFLRNLASIQKRTSPIKFAHLADKSESGSISNLSTKVVAYETDLRAIDELARVEVGHAADLRLHALLLELRDELDARLALMQRLRHVVERVAEARSDAY